MRNQKTRRRSKSESNAPMTRGVAGRTSLVCPAHQGRPRPTSILQGALSLSPDRGDPACTRVRHDLQICGEQGQLAVDAQVGQEVATASVLAA